MFFGHIAISCVAIFSVCFIFKFILASWLLGFDGPELVHSLRMSRLKPYLVVSAYEDVLWTFNMSGHQDPKNASLSRLLAISGTSAHEPPWFLHPLWKKFPPMEPRLMTIIGVLMTAIGMGGICGNLTVVFLLLRCKKLQSSANLFVFNLALADLIMCFGNFPMLVANTFAGGWIFGFVGCKVYSFMGGLSGFVSINTLTLMACDRYTVLHRARRALGPTPRCQSQGLLVALWAYSLGWTLPPFLGWGRSALDGGQISCCFDYMSRTPSNVSYIVAIFVFCFGLQVIAILFCYANVVIAVCRHKRRLKGASKEVFRNQNLSYQSPAVNSPSPALYHSQHLMYHEHVPFSFPRTASFGHRGVHFLPSYLQRDILDSDRTDPLPDGTGSASQRQNENSNRPCEVKHFIGAQELHQPESARDKIPKGDAPGCEIPGSSIVLDDNDLALPVPPQDLNEPERVVHLHPSHPRGNLGQHGHYMRHLRQQDRTSALRRVQKKRRVEVQITRLVVLITLSFFLCWTPFAVVALLGVFGDASLLTPLVSVLPQLLAKAGTVLNPILYALAHPQFRRALSRRCRRARAGLLGQPRPEEPQRGERKVGLRRVPDVAYKVHGRAGRGDRSTRMLSSFYFATILRTSSPTCAGDTGLVGAAAPGSQLVSAAVTLRLQESLGKKVPV